MIRLNGLGADICDANPNDPVCQAFYGDTPNVPAVNPNIATLYLPALNPPGTNQPGTTVTPGNLPTFIGTDMPWYKTTKGLLIIAALAGGGYYLYKRKPKAVSAPAAAVAGLLGIFKPRRRRRRR